MVNNVKTKLLIDTGSEASLISHNLVKKLKVSEEKIIKIPKINLVGANSRKLCEITKSININVNIEGIEINLQTLIAPNIETEIIIGCDELEKHKSIINYEERKLKMDENWISFDLIALNENNRKNMNVYKKEINKNNITRDVEKLEEFDINCPEERKKKIKLLIEEYKNLFTKENRIAKNYVHKIEVNNDIKNFKAKTYPIPYKYKDQVRDNIKELIKTGIIERSTSQYVNPIVVVVKKNGELRLCLDARNINKFSKPQYEAPMSVEAILGRITRTSVFSKLDLKHSFWLIPLHEDSRDYTAFSIDGEIYRFCVVPFGVQSACSALTKALHQILNKYESFVLHYVDDILIFSKNEEEHYDHLQTVLSELDSAGLKLNNEKCEFYKQEVTYLGYKINQNMIQLDPQRIEIIKEYVRPKNLKTLRGFLGMLNYYKRLIPDLSNKEVPLIELLKKNVKWEWNVQREEAFQDIKAQFLKNLKIYHPNYDIPFVLRTDASIHRLAGVLVQNQEIGEVPISFVSRTTKKSEKNYSTSELELASIIFAVTKLRFYLLGNQFTIETDNQALTSILNNKYGNNRIHRWALLLQEYKFEIKYVPGRLNVVPDSITRMEESSRNNGKQVKIGVNILKETEELFSSQRIKNDQRNLSERDKERALNDNDIYYKIINENELYLITKDLAQEILKKLHERYGHIGSRKTWLVFRENYIAKGDVAIIKNIIRSCTICQISKDKNSHNQNIPKSITTNKPLETIAIDFMSNLIPNDKNNRNILIILDNFSKFIKLYPTKRTNTRIVQECLRNYFTELGIPEICIMDNATYFNNERIKTWLKKNNVNPVYTSVRHPCANPSERYIREVIKYLRILTYDHHKQWEQYLPTIEEFMNGIPNTVTKVAPVVLMKRESPDRPWKYEKTENYEYLIEKVNKRLKKNSEKLIKKRMKSIRKQVTFEKGELVIVKALKVPSRREHRCAKLQLPFEGPYAIDNVDGVNSYILIDPITGKLRGNFHISQLYKFHV